MHVLLLTSHYPPDVAATGQLVAEMAEDLAEKGARVTVITARPNYVGSPRERVRLLETRREKGVEVKVLGVPALGRRGVWSRLIPFGGYAAAAAAMAPLVDRPDVVYALSTPPILGGLLGLGIARLKGAHFVYHLQDVYPEIAVALGVLGEGRPLTRASTAAEGFLRSQADVVVTIGEDMRRHVEAASRRPRRVEVIPNWVDTARVQPIDRERNTFRRDHGLEEAFVVGYSGNLGMAHGAEMLPAVAERLQDLEDLRMVIVGDGPARPTLEREVRRRGLRNVVRLPYQPKAVLDQSLSAPDLHLVLQRQETHGLLVPSKIYGILAAGRPVVAAAPEGSELAATVLDHEVGRVVAPGDAEAMAAAIRELYANARLREQMGRYARAAAVRSYSRTLAARRYHALFSELARQA